MPTLFSRDTFRQFRGLLFNQFKQFPPLPDPILHYKLDESSGTVASDSSPSGNDGTLNNMVGTEWTTGKVDGSLAFDGVNDYVNITNNITFAVGGELSFVTWVKLDATAGTGIFSMIGIKEASDKLYQFRIRNYSVDFRSDESAGWTSFAIIGTTTLSVDTWYHIAATVKGDELAVYINGVLEDKNNNGKNLAIATNTSKTIGSYNGLHYLFGEIDDMRVYQKRLTLSEINALYDSQKNL